MEDALERDWMKRVRFLTQALIVSGALNIGLVSAILYSSSKDKNKTSLASLPSATTESLTNQTILRSYMQLSFSDLLLRLENRDLVEDGYTKRDLALACLANFHHFAVEKALGGIVLQKRLLSFSHEGKERDLVLFAGLRDEHFDALLQFAHIEKWPLTAKGLFSKLSDGAKAKDDSLLEAFYCTTEFHSIYALFQKFSPQTSAADVLSLLQGGSWERLRAFSHKLQILQCYTEDVLCEFLTPYAMEGSSRVAVDILLQFKEYLLKRLDDGQLIAFLDLVPKEKGRDLAMHLLVSQRSDGLRKKAAEVLYAAEALPFPDPYDYVAVVLHFFPQNKVTVAKQEPIPAAVLQPSVYKIQPGDSLWKIARKHGVTVEAIMKLNHLESDRLREGRELKIPEKKS